MCLFRLAPFLSSAKTGKKKQTFPLFLILSADWVASWIDFFCLAPFSFFKVFKINVDYAKMIFSVCHLFLTNLANNFPLYRFQFSL